MTRAVLLDLDDTLLGNPTEAFLTAYMGALNRFLCGWLGVEDTLQAVLAATRAVMTSRDALHTNEETFYAALSPLLPASLGDFRSGAEEFYATVYPALQSGTQIRESARPPVEWLAAQGYAVVVATNPFFPRVAVEQRWVGRPAGGGDALRAGDHAGDHAFLQASPGLLRGDPGADRRRPARRSWWATTGQTTSWPRTAPDCTPTGSRPATPRPVGRGTIRRGNAGRVLRMDPARGRIRRPDRAHWSPRNAPRLNGGLAALLGLAREIGPDAWTARPARGEWSPAEIFGHLGETERAVHRPRLVQTAQGDGPFFAASEPGTGACSGDGWDAALAFYRERQITLDFLAGLADDAWDRPAVHHRLGATTLLGMADHIVQHDRAHIRQLRETLAHTQPGSSGVR